MAVFFGDVPAFLRNLTIGQEGDLLRRAGLSYAAGAVTLSTLHGAKGLEWPVVFLCGVGRAAFRWSGRAWTPMRLRSGGCSMWV